MNDQEKMTEFESECFYCQGIKEVIRVPEGEIDLDPNYSYILNYDPCQDCQEAFFKSVTLIEVDDEPTIGFLPLNDQNPTGRYLMFQVDHKDGEDVLNFLKDYMEFTIEPEPGSVFTIPTTLFEEVLQPIKEEWQRTEKNQDKSEKDQTNEVSE